MLLAAWFCPSRCIDGITQTDGASGNESWRQELSDNSLYASKEHGHLIVYRNMIRSVGDFCVRIVYYPRLWV